MGFMDKMREANAKAQEKGTELREKADKRAEQLSKTREEAAERTAKVAKVDTEGSLMTLTSKGEDGRNSTVVLYPNRIERIKAKSMTSLSRANQDSEMIPISRVSHVGVTKKGIRSIVNVTTSGEDISFRTSHDEAARFKKLLSELMLQ